MKTSPALEEVRANADPRVPGPAGRSSPVGPNAGAVRQVEERRLVSVVFVELAPAGIGGHIDPEDLRELVSAGLAQTMSEVEAFGGTVASISGFGMSVLFGAPQSHEDDPERALRAALRIAAAVGQPAIDGSALLGGGASRTGAPRRSLSVRIGVESGTAVVGPIGDGDQMRYGAVGEVIGVAAALQSAAKPGTVLVGPATRAAAEGIFEWGPGQDIPVSSGASSLSGSYLVGARPRPVAEAGRRSLAARATLVGRGAELAVLTDAVRAAVAGRGGAVVVVGEPGLGKTRLVSECRKFFMGWVGAASGRLPLWLEGRCASYASSTPYGAYQQLLCRFMGVPLEAGESGLRPALESAVRAVLGKDSDVLPVLAHMMGMAPGPDGAHLGRMGPAELQHATFAAVRSFMAKPCFSRPHGAGPGGPALVRPDFAPLDSRAGVAGLERPAPRTGDTPARARPRGRRTGSCAWPGPGSPCGSSSSSPSKGLTSEPWPAPSWAATSATRCSMPSARAWTATPCSSRKGWHRYWTPVHSSAAPAVGGSGRDGTAPVPEALERLIRSRADRLSLPAREVIVAASVLGQEIERSALGVVSELDAELDDAVAEVVSAGLLVEVRGQPEPRYRFRHALIREATYGGLLRPQRRQLHARAAWDLEARSDRPTGRGGGRAGGPLRRGRPSRPRRALPGAGRGPRRPDIRQRRGH